MTYASKVDCAARLTALDNWNVINAFTFNATSNLCQFGFVDSFKVTNSTRDLGLLQIYHLYHIDGGFDKPYEKHCDGNQTQCVCPIVPLEKEHVICSRSCHKAFPRQDEEYEACLNCCQGCCTNLPHCPATWAFSTEWSFKCRCTPASKVPLDDVLYIRASGNCDFHNTDCPQLKYHMDFYVI